MFLSNKHLAMYKNVIIGQIRERITSCGKGSIQTRKIVFLHILITTILCCENDGGWISLLSYFYNENIVCPQAWHFVTRDFRAKYAERVIFSILNDGTEIARDIPIKIYALKN